MLITQEDADMNHGTTVLVVEDDVDIGQLLNFMLSREGYRVVMAGDGREASEKIATMAPPGLVLLDVMLPYLDGFQLYARIREQPLWRGVPVMMLTSKSQESDVVRALDAGVSDFITKPFHPAELVARVRRYLRVNSAA